MAPQLMGVHGMRASALTLHRSCAQLRRGPLARRAQGTVVRQCASILSKEGAVAAVAAWVRQPGNAAAALGPAEAFVHQLARCARARVSCVCVCACACVRVLCIDGSLPRLPWSAGLGPAAHHNTTRFQTRMPAPCTAACRTPGCAWSACSCATSSARTCHARQGATQLLLLLPPLCPIFVHAGECSRAAAAAPFVCHSGSPSWCCALGIRTGASTLSTRARGTPRRWRPRATCAPRAPRS